MNKIYIGAHFTEVVPRKDFDDSMGRIAFVCSWTGQAAGKGMNYTEIEISSLL